MKINVLKIKEKLGYLFAVGLSILLLFFFLGNIWIGHEVKRLCQEAKWEYLPDGGKVNNDCVEVLIATLEDKNQGYRTRNHAIWALGQFGDPRAFSVLQKYYTGNIPDREPLDQTISQYELEKAIKLVSGGPNITSWFWR